MSDLLPCPACGFETLSEAYGCYEICEVCGWEDDPVQLANPCRTEGANSESLASAQRAFVEKPHVDFEVYNGFIRCTRWRPLSDEEMEFFKTKEGIMKAVYDEKDAYWSKYS